MNIIFICHGNICRSPLGEILLNDLLTDEEKKRIHAYSRATSLEEIGNDIYPPMKRVLSLYNVPFNRHYAKRIDYKDYSEADYIFYMDDENKYSLIRMFGESNKILPIYSWSPNIHEIEDPWYTGRFDVVVKQITTCIKDILMNID